MQGCHVANPCIWLERFKIWQGFVWFDWFGWLCCIGLIGFIGGIDDDAHLTRSTLGEVGGFYDIISFWLYIAQTR